MTPSAGQVGWVGSNEARGNHFGNSFLHAGTVQGQVFHGAIQFDLSRVPRGAPIRYAALSLTGLDDERLNRAGSGAWEVRWLDPQINADWSRKSFQDIHNAPVLQSILPPLDQADLAPQATNQFVLSADQLTLLQQALIDGQTSIAFRLDGPEAGGDDFFSWDTGYGPATLGTGPALLIVTGPAPATPPPLPTGDFVVVTSTPTPENVLTAAAIVEQATAQAAEIGTATPTPPNLRHRHADRRQLRHGRRPASAGRAAARRHRHDHARQRCRGDETGPLCHRRGPHHRHLHPHAGQPGHGHADSHLCRHHQHAHAGQRCGRAGPGHCPGHPRCARRAADRAAAVGRHRHAAGRARRANRNAGQRRHGRIPAASTPPSPP